MRSRRLAGAGAEEVHQVSGLEGQEIARVAGTVEVQRECRGRPVAREEMIQRLEV